MGNGMIYKRLKNLITLFLLLLVFVVFSGCREQLYTGLSEQEVNEMLAILLRNGISSEKAVGEENTWDLCLDSKDIAVATEILKYNGYPQHHFKDVGDLFKKDGLISSPLEERVRYIYALSQEVSETISHIDGIISARVHIVLPENNPLSDKLVPSSASVFIKHRENAGIESQILKIKELVVNSIEGLDYKNVSVALFPTQAEYNFNMEPEYVRILGIKLSADSLPRFRLISIFLLLFMGLLLAGNVYLLVTTGFRFSESKMGLKLGKMKQKLLPPGKKKKNSK